MDCAFLLTISFTFLIVSSKGTPTKSTSKKSPAYPSPKGLRYGRVDNCHTIRCYQSVNSTAGTELNSTCCPNHNEKCYAMKSAQGRYSQGCIPQRAQVNCKTSDSTGQISCCSQNLCNRPNIADGCWTKLCYQSINSPTARDNTQCCPSRDFKCLIAKNDEGLFTQGCIHEDQPCQDYGKFKISCCYRSLCNDATKVIPYGQLKLVLITVIILCLSVY